MTNFTRDTGVALIASLMLCVAGLSSARAETTIPVIVKDTTSGYWQIVLAGARKAGKDLGVTVQELGAQSESDIDGQIAILQKAVSRNPAAIVIAPSMALPLGKPIDEAAKAVKVVGIDSSAETKSFSSFLTTDNVQAGRTAADTMAAGIKAKAGKVEGDVAIITSIAGAGSLDQRAAGFKEQLAARYPGLKLVADKVADGKASTGHDIVAELITTDPGLKGVFASNLTMAQGAGKAVAEAKMGDTFTVVGFDSDSRLVKMLGGGSIYALIVQDPFRMGYDGVKAALALSKGETVAAFTDTGATAITKGNMDTARSQELLSPKLN